MADTQQLFAHFPEEIQTKLRIVMHVQTYEPGESIFHQDAPATAIYVVVSGRVKVVRVTPDGYESILCVRRTEDYFCPVPVLDGKAHLGTAIAMTEVTLLWVEVEKFRALCSEYPQLLASVQGDCLGEVRYLLNRLEAFSFHNIRERLAITMLDEVRHHRAEENPPIIIKMNQQELAGLVGASRESVSRSLVKMEQDGIVELHRGKVIILDLAKLRRIVAIE